MLNIENSALVIIDIQEKLVAATKYGTEVAQNMAKIAKTASILNIPTILTEQYPKGLGSTVEELRASIKPDTDVIEKSSFFCIIRTTF